MILDLDILILGLLFHDLGSRRNIEWSLLLSLILWLIYLANLYHMSISLALISRPIVFDIPTDCVARWFLGIMFILLVNSRFLVVLLLWAYLGFNYLVGLSCFCLLVNLDRLNTLFITQVRIDSLELSRRGVLLKLYFGSRSKHLQCALLLVDLPLPRSSLVGD